MKSAWKVIGISGATGALAFIALSAAARPARAFDYYELEVYPYQTESLGEMELEQTTTFSNADGQADSQGLQRSSFEFQYGLSDRWTLAGYLDFARPYGDRFQHAGTRFHAQTRFWEKGELPIDLGAYAELAFPKNDDNLIEAEAKLILEKDFGRFTLGLNPALERGLRTVEGVEPGFVFKYGATLAHRFNGWKPHLDLFQAFEGDTQVLLSPAVDVRLGKGFSLGARAGFGLTSATEQRLVGTRLEFEF